MQKAQPRDFDTHYLCPATYSLADGSNNPIALSTSEYALDPNTGVFLLNGNVPQYEYRKFGITRAGVTKFQTNQQLVVVACDLNATPKTPQSKNIPVGSGTVLAYNLADYIDLPSRSPPCTK